jgi:hypothetical protein
MRSRIGSAPASVADHVVGRREAEHLRGGLGPEPFLGEDPVLAVAELALDLGGVGRVAGQRHLDRCDAELVRPFGGLAVEDAALEVLLRAVDRLVGDFGGDAPAGGLANRIGLALQRLTSRGARCRAT